MNIAYLRYDAKTFIILSKHNLQCSHNFTLHFQYILDLFKIHLKYIMKNKNISLEPYQKSWIFNYLIFI